MNKVVQGRFEVYASQYFFMTKRDAVKRGGRRGEGTDRERQEVAKVVVSNSLKRNVQS